MVTPEVCQALIQFHRPIRSIELWNSISQAARLKWQELEWSQVLAPLVFESKLQGILVLGERISGNVYSDQDLRIIATVSEQAALALTNILLVETLRGLAQQLVRSDEEQRNA